MTGETVKFVCSVGATACFRAGVGLSFWQSLFLGAGVALLIVAFSPDAE